MKIYTIIAHIFDQPKVIFDIPERGCTRFLVPAKIHKKVNSTIIENILCNLIYSTFI